MADNKKSFLLYCDIIHLVEQLPNDKAGELFKHILKYVNNKNPTTEDLLVKIAFEPIKQQLKRDLRKYETILVKRSEAGKVSAEKRQQNQHMLTHVESVQQSSTNPTDTVTDNVTDNVNVNVKEKDISKLKNNDSVICVESELSTPTNSHTFLLKNLEERKRNFGIEVASVLKNLRNQYIEEKTENRNFFEYWTEHGKWDVKMRFEKEKSWQTTRRLDTWHRNVEKEKQKHITGGRDPSKNKIQETMETGERETLTFIESLRAKKQQETCNQQ